MEEMQRGKKENTDATGKVKLQAPAIVVEVFCLQARNLPQVETVHFVLIPLLSSPCSFSVSLLCSVLLVPPSLPLLLLKIC